MRITLLHLVLIPILLLLQCSSTKTRISSGNSLLIDNSKNDYNLYSKQADVCAKIKVTEKAIKELSKDYSIVNLKEKNLQTNEIELRIWTSIESDYEKVFVINKFRGKWNVFLLSPKTIDGQIVKAKNGRTILDKKLFSMPKSGWEKISDYIVKELHYPLPYSLDENFTPPILDEGVLVLEMKQSMNYDIVSFREFTKNNDGKKVFNFCKNMEREFETKIGCGTD